MVNIYLMVILMLIMGCNQDSGGTQSAKNIFTITNTTSGQESVFLVLNGLRKELTGGQCVILSASDFDNLKIVAGRGGVLYMGYGEKELCSICPPNNYEIYDEGGLITKWRDGYTFRVTPTFNISETCTNI